RRRRNNSDDLDFEISDDDVLLPIAGILDVLDNYGFVRTTGYLSGNADVYVSLGQVRRYGLRKGDAIVGAIRQPREGENQRQKYNAIVKIDSVNGKPLAEALERPEFARLTPIYPNERLRLENGSADLIGRAIDIAAPIGKGQRALLVSEPRTNRGGALKSIAQSVSENNPEVHLMYLAVNERPEEVTELQRVIRGEVVASPFDHPAEDHAAVSELAIERAKRMVELGNDVVLLVDSLTGLARAYNQIAPTSGRFLVEGVDTATVFPSKRFFGAARNVENGGSLTIIASVLTGYGSVAEEAILDELRVAANSEIKLSKKLADAYLPVQIDIHSSGTKHAEQLTNADELAASFKLRGLVEGADVLESAKNLVQKLESTSTNTELLFSAQRAATN
ncbi:MAG: transcription termination factor Rho, partial [Microbacteriaceae bacterium]|nr:transcription termination factor Rho [Microbacteriaceae bacterium]